jgi:DGQHR domain-containing protein
MQQFGVQFYQASLTASDIDKLVRFEVLSYGDTAQPPVRGGKMRPGAAPSKVNWDLLERRIASSEKAYQRQIIRRKIDELVQYYEQCRQARDLPSIPGAVIISCDERLTFQASGGDSRVGILKVPEREGILRAIDGQHRLLALHADIERFQGEEFSVPAIIFDRLPEDHVVQMFVTINAKHTRLNASHLVSLSGRQLYRDEALATAHDVVRAGAERSRGFSAVRRDQAAWGWPGPRGSGTAGPGAEKTLRRRCVFDAPIGRYARRGQEVLRQLLQADSACLWGRLERPEVQHQVGAPWGRRIGDLRFETEGAWKRSGTTVDSLAKELRLALQYPEGAAV